MNDRRRLCAVALTLAGLITTACSVLGPEATIARTPARAAPSPTATFGREATQTVRAAATRTAAATRPIAPEMALSLFCTSSIYDQRNPMPGRIVRFRTPVAINPHGNTSILKAIANYEARSNGLITFQIVDSDPAAGVTVISGDAVDRYGQPGCGNVTSQPAPTSGHKYAPDSTGALVQRAYLHIGSSGCDDTHTGWTSSSVAEHELAHALGVGSHFDGFSGNEGLSNELYAVIMLLYSSAPGTDMSSICPAR